MRLSISVHMIMNQAQDTTPRDDRCNHGLTMCSRVPQCTKLKIICYPHPCYCLDGYDKWGEIQTAVIKSPTPGVLLTALVVVRQRPFSAVYTACWLHLRAWPPFCSTESAGLTMETYNQCMSFGFSPQFPLSNR